MLHPVAPRHGSTIPSTRDNANPAVSSLLPINVNPSNRDTPDLLSILPQAVASTAIGPYLTDYDARRWAQCSARSHQQLQQRAWDSWATVEQTLRLSQPFRRPPAAFGQVKATRIRTADEWVTRLPTLPPMVERVRVEVLNHEELGRLYQSPAATHDAATTNDNDNDKDNGPPIIQVPESVIELRLDCGDSSMVRLFANWLRHLRLPSRLRILHLPVAWWDDICPHLPASLLHHLPNSLVELQLPCRYFRGSPADYPRRWPCRLMTLRIANDAPFASLPPLPTTLTRLNGGRVKWKPELAKLSSLPFSIKKLDLTIFNEPINDGCLWVLPSLTALTYLRLDRFNQPVGGDRLYFPPALCELHLPSFHQADICLPATLTTLTIGTDQTVQPPFARLRWPKTLHTLAVELIMVEGAHLGHASLRHWTPPPALTALRLGWRWNLPLTELTLPDTLQSLEFGEDFNQSLTGFVFPASLQHLAFMEKCTPSLCSDDWIPPPNLMSITLSIYRENFHLPPTLKRFTAGFQFQSRFPGPRVLRSLLPRGLQTLDLRRAWLGYDAPKDWLLSLMPLPPILHSIYLPDLGHLLPIDEIPLPTSDQLPRTLRLVQHGSWLPENNPLRKKLEAWANSSLPAECALLFVQTF